MPESPRECDRCISDAQHADIDAALARLAGATGSCSAGTNLVSAEVKSPMLHSQDGVEPVK
jgi:hypothetical protein